MKRTAINGRWVIYTTDFIADWDAVTGDPALDTGWETVRFRSLHRHLKYGDVFFDIGTEHGALTTVIAREFVGAENMVLFEPSPEFWPNIAKHWRYNGLNDPLACWPGFVNETSSPRALEYFRRTPTIWPPGCEDMSMPELGGMAYRYLNDDRGIPSVSLDDWVAETEIVPHALNIDVEGAELLVLRGAEGLLADSTLTYVWVSVHPDLMERDYTHTKQELLNYMDELGWMGEHLGTDHEEHHLWTRQ